MWFNDAQGLILQMIFHFIDDALYTLLGANMLLGDFSSFQFLELVQLAFDERNMIFRLIILAIRVNDSDSFNGCVLLFELGEFGEELKLREAVPILQMIDFIHKLAVNFNNYYRTINTAYQLALPQSLYFRQALSYILFCISFKHNNFNMLNSRGKSSHTISRKQTALPLRMTEGFPLKNRKIRLQNWEDQCVTIKQYRSRGQLAKKKCESIPLLRNINLNAQIMRSHKQQYNIYMRKNHNITDLTSNIKIINGHVPHNKETIQIKRGRQGLHSATLNTLNWQTAHLRQTQPIMDKRLLLSGVVQTLDSLQVRGKEKKLSPQRHAGRRSMSSFDHRQLKL